MIMLLPRQEKSRSSHHTAATFLIQIINSNGGRHISTKSSYYLDCIPLRTTLIFMNSSISANIHFSFSLLLLTSKSAAQTFLPGGLIKMQFSSDNEGNFHQAENATAFQHETLKSYWKGHRISSCTCSSH